MDKWEEIIQLAEAAELKEVVKKYVMVLKIVRNIKESGETDIEKALKDRIDVLWAEIEVLENE